MICSPIPLTNISIRNAKRRATPFKLTDSNGLYLEVRPSGTKLWRYRYRIAGKENIYAIGQYFADKKTGHISLEVARRARDEARTLVRQGIRPAHERTSRLSVQIVANANTFQAVAQEWISQNRRRWSDTYVRQVEKILTANVFPSIGNLPIRAVNAAQILAILKRLEKRDATTVALLIRQWCSAVFRYAVATLRADGDPAAALRGAITRPPIEHSRPLSREELQSLANSLEKYGGTRTTIIALLLMLLTFVRTKELRAARWEEISFLRVEWRIPAERMKMRDEHIVPLSTQAVILLQELHKITGDKTFLFPNQRRSQICMSATTLNRALERMGFSGRGTIGFSAHGFRSTASTILHESGFSSIVIERQLAHQDRNKVRATYNQASYLRERRMMMQEWADIVDEIIQEQNTAQGQPG